MKGTGNQQDYGMRIYDPRIGKFLSVDPLTKEYPWYTPYSFSGNKPISFTDRDGEEEAFTLMRAQQQIREETARLYKIDPKLAKAYNDKGNLTGLTFAGGALTLGWGAYGMATMGVRAVLTNVLRGGAIGAGINGSISMMKGDDGYEIVKSTTSGFFSGAILGIGWGSSLSGIFAGGGVSGGIGEIVNQEFDNKFGDNKGYNLEKIAISGGIGAVANVLSNSVINRINKSIESKLASDIAETNTSAYVKIVRKAIQKENPRIGARELKTAVNEQIKNAQDGLKKGANSIKVAAQQAVERGIDYLTDKFNDSQKKN